MSRVKLRSPMGSEYSFHTEEEFASALAADQVTSDWLVYHERAGQWLPIALHPVFQSHTRHRASLAAEAGAATFDALSSNGAPECARPSGSPA
jgi:hypothetical protein